MIKKYKRRYVVLKANPCDVSSNLKSEIMRVLSKVESKEEQEEVRPLVLKSGKDMIIVRVSHASLMQFKKSVESELSFLKVIFVSGTLKSIRERMGLSKDDIKTM